MTELQRVLAALDGIGVVGPHQHHHAKAEVARAAARVIRELSAEVERLNSELEKAALHVCSWDAGFDEGWLKRDVRSKAEVERLKQEARAQIWLERVVRDKALDELLSIRNVQEELRKGGK